MNIYECAKKEEEGFRIYFGISAQQSKRFLDPMLSCLTGHRFEIDIFEFDDWLHQQGYEEKRHGSMKDYIEKKYGKEAAKFIKGLIGARKIKRRKIKRRKIKRRKDIRVLI